MFLKQSKARLRKAIADVSEWNEIGWLPRKAKALVASTVHDWILGAQNHRDRIWLYSGVEGSEVVTNLTASNTWVIGNWDLWRSRRAGKDGGHHKASAVICVYCRDSSWFWLHWSSRWWVSRCFINSSIVQGEINWIGLQLGVGFDAEVLYYFIPSTYFISNWCPQKASSQNDCIYKLFIDPVSVFLVDFPQMTPKGRASKSSQYNSYRYEM